VTSQKWLQNEKTIGKKHQELRPAAITKYLQAQPSHHYLGQGEDLLI
jgi:hypothetical protein